MALTAAGSTVYVADRKEGLHIIDVSDPTTPTLLSTYDAPGGDPDSLFYYDVKVSGNTAYAINSDYGLVVIDVSDPTAPTLISELPFAPGSRSFRSLVVDGTTVYLASRSAGLQIVDVSDPLVPLLLGTFTSADAWDVAVSGNVAYVADRLDGLFAIDVSDPALPTLLSHTPSAGASLGVAVEGTTAYVACKFSGGGGGEIQVFDVASPAAPILIGTEVTPNSAFKLEIVGQTAYMAENSPNGELQIIDISDPIAPDLFAVASTPSNARDVTVVGTIAYVADNDSGLQIFEVGACHDTDLDGLDDSAEISLGTDPSNPDTDGDGLLDGVEVDIAMGLACPSPLTADSDMDGLSDGQEVLVVGTDPCNSDTDADGVSDGVDPLPTIPGVTTTYFEAITRLLAEDIEATDLSLFSGPNNNAKKGRRNSLANRVRNAANAAASFDSNAAEALLTSVRERIDGQSPPPDWMPPSVPQSTLLAELDLLLYLLSL